MTHTMTQPSDETGPLEAELRTQYRQNTAINSAGLIAPCYAHAANIARPHEQAYLREQHRLNTEIDNLRQEVKALHRERIGEVWYWQGDAEDHLESLTCPVLIEAADLRSIFRERTAWNERDKALWEFRGICEHDTGITRTEVVNGLDAILNVASPAPAPQTPGEKATMKNITVSFTPTEFEALQYAVGNFTVGDADDCGGNRTRHAAMHRIFQKLSVAKNRSAAPQTPDGGGETQDDAQR